jgi:Fic family protein
MLRKILFVIILACACCFSCNNKKEEKPVTALDTGRAFIRASLDGNFDAAQQLLLKDTQNLELFESYKLYYNRLSAEKKKNYKAASYDINKYLDVDDSTTIINYSNSYMKKPMEIKVVRRDKEWSVDFKYISSGNLPID